MAPYDSIIKCMRIGFPLYFSPECLHPLFMKGAARWRSNFHASSVALLMSR